MFAELRSPLPDGKNSHLKPLEDNPPAPENKSVASGQQQAAGYLVTGLSLVAIGVATLTPSSGQSLAHACIICGSYGTTDAVLNVILFAPLGAGLYLFGVSGLKALTIACALSVSIELAQLLVIPGRDATLGDVVMNTLGGSLGFLIALKRETWVTPEPRVARTLALAWGVAWLLLQALTSWAFVPSYPSSRYYGEIAPTLAGFAELRGEVDDPRLGEIRIPDSPFPSTDAVRSALSSGSSFFATATSSELSDDIAPVVRIADDRQREIAMLGLRSSGLVFRVRTVAAILRLRPPTFGLAIPALDAGKAENLRISAQYRPSSVGLQALASTAVRADEITVSPALGWTLLVPFQWFIRSGFLEHAVDSLWIVVFLIPFGYWGGRWTAQWRNRNGPLRIVIAAFVQLLIVAVGLTAIPLLFGLRAVPLAEFLLGVFALAAGQYSGTLWTNRSR
jgi:hypothetical protein